MDPMMLGFAISLFVAVLLLLLAGYQWWYLRHSQTSRRFTQRVQMALLNSVGHGQDSNILKQRLLSQSPALARVLTRLPRIGALDRMLLQSGLDWSVGKFVGLTLTLAGSGVLAGILFAQRASILLALGLAFASLPLVHVRRCRQKRLIKLEQQLPETTDMIGRALRAGHSLPSALEMAGSQLPAPIGTEFGMVFNEVNFGVPMEDALDGLLDRVPMEDLRYLVIAILIQRESGGNLAEILDNVSSIIRKRLQLIDKVRMLSAEGRLGAWILTVLPLVVGGALCLLNPAFMATLWTSETGLHMLWTSVVMMVVGVFWMRRVIRIHV